MKRKSLILSFIFSLNLFSMGSIHRSNNDEGSLGDSQNQQCKVNLASSAMEIEGFKKCKIEHSISQNSIEFLSDLYFRFHENFFYVKGCGCSEVDKFTRQGLEHPIPRLTSSENFYGEGRGLVCNHQRRRYYAKSSNYSFRISTLDNENTVEQVTFSYDLNGCQKGG